MDQILEMMRPAKATGQPVVARKDIENLCEFLARKDFGFLPGGKTRKLLAPNGGDALAGWSAFSDSWNRLEQDMYMRDGGTYRQRRHATFSALPSGRIARLEPHQPHYQSLAYNRLNGGVARHFAPFEKDTLDNPVMQSALTFCCELFGRLAPFYSWHIEAHQFRIDASSPIANPTPEGIHRDGVNFVFMMLINRTNVVNGESRVFDRMRQPLADYTLTQPFDAAIVNDERVMHSVTPIVRLDPSRPAHRDMLVITFCKK